MKHRETIEAAHGTYREFEDAVWNTLGETSVRECQEACDKYRRELAEATELDLKTSPLPFAGAGFL